MAMVLASRLVPAGITRFTDMGSTRFRLEGSKDGFRPFGFETDPDLLTRNDVRGGDVGVSEGECSVGVEFVSCPASGPHTHFCFRGIATFTPPQAHGFPGGHGHVLSGRPGFRTGTMTRSLKWLHFVDRWPRMQGALFWIHVSDTMCKQRAIHSALLGVGASHREFMRHRQWESCEQSI